MDYPLQSKRLTPQVVDEVDVRNNTGSENEMYHDLAET